jgi:hypothetical protein
MVQRFTLQESIKGFHNFLWSKLQMQETDLPAAGSSPVLAGCIRTTYEH